MSRSDKAKATMLRLEGKSYGEIGKTLQISSKGTLSYWFRDLIIPSETKKRLAANIRRAHERGLFRFNKERSRRVQNENREAEKKGRLAIGRLTERELMLVGAALYWGEGTKSTSNGTYFALAFANSDPGLVRIYMKFIREIFHVPEEKIRAGIHIHDNILPDTAKRFWSRVTKLPVGRFYIVKHLSRASKRKRPTNRLPYGTVAIKVHKRILFYNVMGFIKGLSDNI